MISFPCLCGEKFSITENLAGTQFQCPKCGLLVSVPTLDDIGNLDADGAYSLDSKTETKPARRHQTAMLPTDAGIGDFGAPDEFALKDELAATTRDAPRYDPITGDLIRAIDVLPHIQSVAQKAPVRVQAKSKSKNRGQVTAVPTYAWIKVFGEMWMVWNMFVVGIMALIHITFAFGLYWTFVLKGYLFFFMPLVFGTISAAYFSTIVQEIGHGCEEALPTPVRHFEWHTDIFYPLVHITLSLAACLLPAVLAADVISNPHARLWTGGILLGIGAAVFPAFFLTLAADGILANLRPDRVLGVISACGFNYLPVAIAWAAGAFLTVNGVILQYGSMIRLMNPFDILPPPAFIGAGGAVGAACIVGGLFLCYYACWLLGLLWRRYHKEFPWVHQRFERLPVVIVQRPAAHPPQGH